MIYFIKNKTANVNLNSQISFTNMYINQIQSSSSLTSQLWSHASYRTIYIQENEFTISFDYMQILMFCIPIIENKWLNELQNLLWINLNLI